MGGKVCDALCRKPKYIMGDPQGSILGHQLFRPIRYRSTNVCRWHSCVHKCKKSWVASGQANTCIRKDYTLARSFMSESNCQSVVQTAAPEAAEETCHLVDFCQQVSGSPGFLQHEREFIFSQESWHPLICWSSVWPTKISWAVQLFVCPKRWSTS